MLFDTRDLDKLGPGMTDIPIKTYFAIQVISKYQFIFYVGGEGIISHFQSSFIIMH